MKKAFLICSALIIIAVMTAYKSGTANNVGFIASATTATNPDTLWADDYSYWEIKNPFSDNGKTVLYRSCVHEEQMDGSSNEIVLSYYLRTRGTMAYDSTLHKIQSIFGDQFTDKLAESGETLNHVSLGETPRHWYPVRRYKGKNYLYYINGCGLYLTEEAIIFACGDFWSYQLKGVEELSDGSFRFSYIGLKDSVETATMQLIDSEKGTYRLDSSLKSIGTFYTTETHLEEYDIIELEGDPIVSIDEIEFEN